MKGMYCTEWITWLTEPDSKKIEERFIKWAKRSNGKDVMLFDRSSIGVGATIKVLTEPSVYQIKLEQIVLEYTCINGDMCILRKVLFQKQGEAEILYQIPNRWDGVVPYFAY